MSSPPTSWARPELGSEVALALVSLATVAGFSRLYADLSFFWPLAAFVLVGHVLAAVCRRRQLGAVPSVAIAVGALGLLVGWLLFPSTTLLGIPTPGTLHAASDALHQAANRFSEVIAPAPVLPGFQLASAVALWGAVWFADWSAFRIWATAESVAPCAVLFTFGALLGAPRHRSWATVLFIAAVLLFVLLHRTTRQETGRTWVAASPARGRRALLQVGAVVGLLAVVGGATLGPQVPGATSKAVLAWRQTRAGSSSRVTVSPLVDIRRRLVDQSDTLAFIVRSDQRAYWRLTSLDSFNGQIWSSSGEFTHASTKLPSRSVSGVAGRLIHQDFTIHDLSAIWVPNAFEARRVSSGADLRWDEGSSTLIVDNDRRTSDSLNYQVVSQAPVYSAAALQQDTTPTTGIIRRQYLGLPKNLPEVVARSAADVTRRARSPYDKAIALQQWFRTQFTYDLSVAPGHGDNAITTFLADRRGYCEQFAGTYAAMARTLGMPSRVAVGFTPGDADPESPQIFHVKGKHAHAWPEIYFPGIGWVPFEPTPGRGAPGAEAWTGVREEQDTPVTRPPTASSSTTSSPGTTPATSRSDRAGNGGRVRTVNQPQPPRTQAGGSPGRVLRAVATAVGLVLAAWLLVVGLLPVVRRRRRRARATTAAARVQLAWDESTEPIEWVTRSHPSRWETHLEYADRVGAALGPLAGPHHELAHLAAAASWSAAEPDGAAAARAGEIAAALRHTIVGELDWRQRVRLRLSLRRALGRPVTPRLRPGARQARWAALRRSPT
ncbi:MAG: hypothetical protein JWM05_2074 [Acidimicrobiales bacterium]|nr:hypothetical protein [Acidimicrobiales bacterium]